MSPISDQELQRHLSRRSSKAILAADRKDVLAAVADARTRPRFSFRMRPRLLLAPIAAAVLVVLVGVPLLWTLSPGPGPSPSAPPSPSPMSQPTASPGPLAVLTQDQLIALANDPLAIGRVVLANAQFAPVPMSSQRAACAPPDACDIGQIGVNPGVPVMAGWREATMPGEGIFDLTEGHWFVRLQPPAAFQKQVLALRIGRGSVEYLGTVQETGSSLVWSPSDVPAGSAAPSSIYAVNGWLVQTMIAECPAPPAGTGPSDPSYWCGGSFITAEQTSPRQLLDLGGLHVQWDAYPDYAPDASPNLGQGTEPRYGTYLVRPIGERYTTSGMSEIWRLVGRLDPPMSAASSLPSASPSATPRTTALVQVHTTQQLSDMIGDPAWVGRYVLARTRMSRLLDYPATCPGAPKACPYAFLPDTAGPDLVVWTGPPWPPIPEGEGIFAFQVGETWVEYLGTVQQTGNSLVWSPGSLPGATAAPLYSIYAVSGWLVRTPPIPCPAPPDGDVSYWCGGSFITPTAIDFNYTPNVLDPGGLHVQADAYGNFAPNPTTTGGGGATSDRAIYLVRPVGQLPHEPNAWSLVGRLDPPMTGPTPSTTSTP